MNRGSKSVTESPWIVPSSFNEAPIHESGKFQGLDRRATRVRQASMRPRFMNRGSLGRMHGCLSPFPASMRPRFMNRGSVSENASGRLTTALLQ